MHQPQARQQTAAVELQQALYVFSLNSKAAQSPGELQQALHPLLLRTMPQCPPGWQSSRDHARQCLQAHLGSANDGGRALPHSLQCLVHMSLL